jgi:hypothetical protein
MKRFLKVFYTVIICFMIKLPVPDCDSMKTIFYNNYFLWINSSVLTQSSINLNSFMVVHLNK